MSESFVDTNLDSSMSQEPNAGPTRVSQSRFFRETLGVGPIIDAVLVLNDISCDIEESRLVSTKLQNRKRATRTMSESFVDTNLDSSMSQEMSLRTRTASIISGCSFPVLEC
jgi:hypothetical protein